MELPCEAASISAGSTCSRALLSKSLLDEGCSWPSRACTPTTLADAICSWTVRRAATRAAVH